MKNIATILDKTLKKLPNAQKIKGQMVVDVWPHVVGEHIAAKTVAMSFKNGVLFVWVKDSVWAQHLSLQRKQIITKLNRAAKSKTLTDLRFQVGGKRPTQPEDLAMAAVEQNWRQTNLDESTLAKINGAFSDHELPIDLEEKMKSFFQSQKKRINWYLEQGYIPCEKCGMPQIVIRPEKICLCCKIEENG